MVRAANSMRRKLPKTERRSDKPMIHPSNTMKRSKSSISAGKLEAERKSREPRPKGTESSTEFSRQFMKI